MVCETLIFVTLISPDNVPNNASVLLLFNPPDDACGELKFLLFILSFISLSLHLIAPDSSSYDHSSLFKGEFPFFNNAQ